MQTIYEDATEVVQQRAKALEAVLCDFFKRLDALGFRSKSLVFSYDHAPFFKELELSKRLSLLEAQMRLFEQLCESLDDMAIEVLDLRLPKAIEGLAEVGDDEMTRVLDNCRRLLDDEMRWSIREFRERRSNDWKENRRLFEQALGRLGHDSLAMLFAFYQRCDKLSLLRGFFPELYRRKTDEYRALKRYLRLLLEKVSAAESIFRRFLAEKLEREILVDKLLAAADDLQSFFEAMMTSLNNFEPDEKDPHLPIRDLFYSDLQDLHSMQIVLPRIFGVFRKAQQSEDNASALLHDARTITVHLEDFSKAVDQISQGVSKRLWRF